MSIMAFTLPAFLAQIKETSKLRVTGFCEGNSSVTGEFPAQVATNASSWSFSTNNEVVNDLRPHKFMWRHFYCGYILVTNIWNKFRSTNGLLSGGIKPLHEAVMTYHPPISMILWYLHGGDISGQNVSECDIFCYINYSQTSMYHYDGVIMSAIASQITSLDHDCFLNCLFRRRSNKTSKLRVTGLCAWNSPGTGEFPAQMVSNAENVSIWWRHHGVNLPTHQGSPSSKYWATA